jgi:hypothetical protein
MSSRNGKELDSSFTSLADATKALSDEGCHVVIAKLLAPHQDNEKNQIYFGKGSPTSQLFPGTLTYRGLSTSRGKGNSRPTVSSPIVELKVDLSWISPGPEIYSAPNAKLIEYSQYPETRLSGFISGCKSPPDALRRNRQFYYGDRVLLLGLRPNGLLGAVVTSKESLSLLGDYSDLPPWGPLPTFRQLWPQAGNLSDQELLASELSDLVGRGFAPIALKDFGSKPFSIGPMGQAGGWTLEALLGIPRNSIAAPDKYGFEIKSVSSGKVSLLTTEPDFGFRHDEGVVSFLNEFGRQGTVNPSQRVFSGVHVFGIKNEQTGCILRISNWDGLSHSPSGNTEPQIELVHVASETIVAGWTFSKIGASWSKKHAGAFYVRTTKDPDEGQIKYHFGPEILICTGTTALHFLQGVSRGVVYLDPGDRFSEEQGPKKRTQWRVQGTLTGLLPSRLAHLYEITELRDLSQPNLK